MEKDKITFIEEKKIQKEQEKKVHFEKNIASTDPIKSRFAKFCLDKKQIKVDDLI